MLEEGRCEEPLTSAGMVLIKSRRMDGRLIEFQWAQPIFDFLEGFLVFLVTKLFFHYRNLSVRSLTNAF